MKRRITIDVEGDTDTLIGHDDLGRAMRRIAFDMADPVEVGGTEKIGTLNVSWRCAILTEKEDSK